jgi:hypothetical protein
LNKKDIILSLLLVFLFTGLSLGQDASNTSISENILANESTSVNETADLNATEVGTGPGLNFIWSFNGIEPAPIIMVLSQDGSDLYGRAKYEPEGAKPWNAEVVGSVKENAVELTMTAQEDMGLVTTKMSGTYANETISGNFTQISGGMKVGSGTFNAMWISPDTSSYTPAVIEEPKVETPAPAVVNDTAASQGSAGQATETKTSQSRFHDVRQDADKILTGVGDISGIPIGMGGAGGLQ